MTPALKAQKAQQAEPAMLMTLIALLEQPLKTVAHALVIVSCRCPARINAARDARGKPLAPLLISQSLAGHEKPDFRRNPVMRVAHQPNPRRTTKNALFERSCAHNPWVQVGTARGHAYEQEADA